MTDPMNSSSLFLDTNIISHFMRDATGLAAMRVMTAQDTGRKVMTSIVVQCELEFGLSKRPSRRLELAYAEVMQRIDVLPLDTTVVAHYAAIRNALERQGTPIGPNDTLIAAHALSIGAVLVTDNDDEFRRVPGLQVENWLRNATAVS